MSQLKAQISKLTCVIVSKLFLKRGLGDSFFKISYGKGQVKGTTQASHSKELSKKILKEN